MKQFSFVTVLLTTFFISACSDSASTGTVTLKGAGSSSGLSATFEAVDPTEMNLKIYKFAVSASASCTNLVTVYENDSPTYTNFLGNPTIGSGALATGSYPCIVMEVSDNIKFKPATSEGACTANTEYTLDVCRTDSSGTSTLIDGTAVTCTGSSGGAVGDDRVAIYLSTSGAASNTAFIPSSPFPLGSAFTASATTTAHFIVDGTGKVESNFGDCDMQPPDFDFQ